MRLLLTEVYAAGEAPIVAADGRALARAVRVAGKVEPMFVEQVDRTAGSDPRRRRAIGDVVMTMGAGSIGGVAGIAGNDEGRGSKAIGHAGCRTC